jgi:hypothetical protein
MEQTRITATEYQEKHFGKVLDCKNIDESFAKIFAEGSPALEKLLLSMWHNGIVTNACCKGHILKPVFIKKILWMEKHISEEEYLKNIHKLNYYRRATNFCGYISFKYSCNNMMAAAHSLRDSLNKMFPDIESKVSFSSDSISIYLDKNVMPKYAEKFFEGVMEILPEWTKSYPQCKNTT